MLRLRRGYVPAPAVHVPRYSNITLEAFAGSSTTGNTITMTGSLSGDLLLALNTTGTATPPVVAPTDHTWIGAGIGSDEATTDTAGRLSYKFATGTDEVIAAAGSSRREAVALRGVDPAFATFLSDGVTYAYAARSGANFIMPALGTFPRRGVVLGFGKQVSTNTIGADAPLLFIDAQNAANGEAFVWWSGESNSLDSVGTLIGSYTGQTTALSVSNVGSVGAAIWIPAAPL